MLNINNILYALDKVKKQNPEFKRWVFDVDTQDKDNYLEIQVKEKGVEVDYAEVTHATQYNRIALQFQILIDYTIELSTLNKLMFKMEEFVKDALSKQKICKECGATPAEPNSDYCKKHINTKELQANQRFNEAYNKAQEAF